ncbi:MAG: hypothetical protein HQM04_17615 [Magnetococcales bacterium]|nr:hypothetical protein [Magnetococcales bacterium]
MSTKKPLCWRMTDGRPTELSASDNIPPENIPEMGAASTTSAGTAGAVPAPPIGGLAMFLRGDKQWVLLTPLADPNQTVLTALWPGDLIQWDGTSFRNLPLSVGSPGAAGVEAFYNASPTILAAGAQNGLAVNTLSKTPVTTGELEVSVTASTSTVPLAAWLYDTALGRTTIPAGTWTISLYGGVDTTADGRLTVAARRMFEVIVEGMALTTTGSGTTRTATAASGTPFVSGDASSNHEVSNYLQTPKGLYQITGYTSPTVVTIAVPSGYVNEAGVAWNKWRGLFMTLSATAFTSISPIYMPQTWDSVQNAFSIAATSKLGAVDYALSQGGLPTTLTLLYDGNTDLNRNSRIYSPIPAGVSDHASLTNLQGGAVGQYYHLTAAYNNAVANLTTTEIGTLSGVTSAIQTQLSGKQATVTGAATSITSSNLTVSRALVSDGSGKVAVSAVTSTELGYLSGVTSAIQSQIAARMANPMTTAGDLLYGGASGTPTRLANGSAGQVLQSQGGTSPPVWVTPGSTGESAWTSRTAAANNTWQSVAYGNGMFVAVANSGSGNRVMTSPDAINWTTRVSAADIQWVGVTYGNGLFVAVSQTGTNRVMTSPDGITWTQRSTGGLDFQWQSVCYGAGKFVAVSLSGTNQVMTSPDGMTWTGQTAAAVRGWRSVIHVPALGLFVAVAMSGSGNRVMTSPDAVTWTLRASANDALGWTGVAYGNGILVAVTQDGTTQQAMTSPDGITWTLRTTPYTSMFFSAVVYGQGLFMAISTNGTIGGAMTSVDGMTWAAKSSPNSTISVTGMGYANGVFIALGSNLVLTRGNIIL